MRQLTKKQKVLLDEWYDQIGQHEHDLMFDAFDKIPLELVQRLEKINDTEILYQEVNRYIGDKVSVTHKFTHPF